MSKMSIINFVKEIIQPQNSSKYLPWGVDNQFPNNLLSMYDTVPEHSSACDFIEELIVGQGVNSDVMDFWTIKKLVSDYYIFGGYTVKVTKNNAGKYFYEYIDISKMRLNKEKTKIGYCEVWGTISSDVTWYQLVNDKNDTGIYLFKNIKSREAYPRPYYLSSEKSIETLSVIIDYHFNNASNGFSPNVIINIPGVSDPAVQREYEEGFKMKYTGQGQKFIINYSDSKEMEATISKLQDDNLDTKFKDLQLFLRDEIIIGHKLTSGNLVGVNTENKGFSKAEYDESITIFKEIVIKGFRNELVYSFIKLTKIDNILFLDEIQKENITVDKTTTEQNGGTQL